VEPSPAISVALQIGTVIVAGVPWISPGPARWPIL